MDHDPLQLLLRRAAKRERGQRGLRWSGVGLAAGLAGAAVLLIVDRITGLRVPVGWFLALPLTGAAIATLLGVTRRTSPSEIARRLDRRWRLQDRLATAAAVAAGRERPYDPGFAALVARDAEDVSTRLDVRGATPLRPPVTWGYGLLGAVLLALGVWLIPSAGSAADADAVATTASGPDPVAERQLTAETLSAVVDDLSEEPIPEEAADEVDAIAALADQLASGDADADARASRIESAARLTELAEEVAERAERDAESADALARRFARMPPPGGDATDAERALQEALRRGDFERAAETLEDLLAQREGMSEDDRAAAAQTLREISRAATPAETDTLPEATDAIARALEDQGLDADAIDRLLDSDESNPTDTLSELLEEGVDEPVAQELARELADQRRADAADRQRERDAQSVADAFEEAADDLEDADTSPASEPDPVSEGENDPADETKPGQTPPAPDPTNPDATAAPERQPGDAETQPRQPGDADTRPPPPADAGDPRSPDENAPSQTPPPGAPPPDEAATRDETGSEQTPPDPPDGRSPQPSPEGDTPGAMPETPAPDAAERVPTPAVGGEREMPADGTPDQPDAAKRGPAETLRELAQRRQSSGERRRFAERARDAARELAEGMTGEERESWARRWQRDQTGDGFGDALADPPPSATPRDPAFGAGSDVVDLTGDETGGEPVFEWLTPDGGPGATAGSGGGAVADRVARARRAAERAVEETAVPSRYHEFIRRYFDRLPETVEAGRTPSTPEAPAKAPPPTPAPPPTTGSGG
ncbi:MAG: hypothetical protein HKO59_07970 [Phycisphaerales bacterium]|nr:hypothetical protein [Phycisphaerales bacterium]